MNQRHPPMVLAPAAPRPTPTSGRRSRVAWGILDQALASLGNFALSVLVARAVDVEEFGIFAVTQIVYFLVVGTTRGLVSEPLLVLYSGAEPKDSEGPAADSMGAAVVLGAAAGVLTIIGALFGGDGFRLALLVLGLALPGLVLQDAVRFVAVAWGRTRVAAMNDLVWTVLMAALASVAWHAGPESSWPYLAAWGLAGSVAGACGLAQLRLGARLGGWRRFLTSHRTEVQAYGLEAVAQRGSYQMANGAVAMVTGVAGAAALRGAELVTNPLAVLGQAVRLVAVPEGVRQRRIGATHVHGVVVRVIVVQLAVTALWAVALPLVPTSVGRALLGPTWDVALPLLPLLLLRSAFSAFAIGGEVGLRALADSAGGLRARMFASAIILVGGVLGVALGDVRGAAAGFAGAYACTAAVYLRAYVTAARAAT